MKHTQFVIVISLQNVLTTCWAANAWQLGAPPAGRPYEIGADTSGYAIGGVVGQCDAENGKLRPLLYITAHLAKHQQHWHSFVRELWELTNLL